MNRRLIIVPVILAALSGLAGCGSDTVSELSSSSRFEELGVSFDYPVGWDILQSEPSEMGPTVIFNADGGNPQSNDLVLAMFIQLREGESGMNDRLLQAVYAGHEELLDQALIESATRGDAAGRVAGKDTQELEPTASTGGYVIRQTCEGVTASGLSTPVERWFEVEDSAPTRVLLISQQSTAEGRTALQAGLNTIRETLDLQGE